MPKTRRLNRSDWLAAGFAALVSDGPDALKAEPMARRMGTTKGSFYWHFRDVGDFHQALFDAWEQHAFQDVVAALEREPSLHLRLRKLAQIAGHAAAPVFGGVAPEPAIRAWARAETAAAQAVRRVDRQRLDYLQDLTAQLGLGNPDFARLLYAALIGLEDLASRDDGDIAQPLGTLADVFLTLE